MENLKNRPLEEGEIKELVKKAIAEGKEEAKYLLRIEEWNRPGDSFVDYGKFEVLRGEVEKVLVDKEYDYPTTNKNTYIVIPKTRAVVIFFEEGNNYDGKTVYHSKIYIFSNKFGWKSLDLY